MTTEAFTLPDTHVINGTGPYAVQAQYRSADDFLVEIETADGSETVELAPHLYFITPAGPAMDGNLTLEPATAALYGERFLHITRQTRIEQGWAARNGAREASLELQLDRLTQGLQDIARQAGSALRVRGTVAMPYRPIDTAVPMWSAAAQGFVNGPTAAVIFAAAGHAAAAENSAAASLASSVQSAASKTAAADSATLAGQRATLALTRAEAAEDSAMAAAASEADAETAANLAQIAYANLISSDEASKSFEFFGGGPAASGRENSDALKDWQELLLTTAGGGVMKMGAGTHYFDECSSGESYEVGGTSHTADQYSTILKPGISLEGLGPGVTRMQMAGAEIAGIGCVSPLGNAISKIGIIGNQGQLVATGRSGIMVMNPSSVGRTNLIAPGEFDGGNAEGWTDFAEDAAFSIQALDGRLRLSFGTGYTGQGRAVKNFPTVVGEQYRVKIHSFPLSTGAQDQIRIAIGNSGAIADRFFQQNLKSETNFQWTATFVAQSTTSTIQIFGVPGSDNPIEDLEGVYLDMLSAEVTQFDVEDQLLHCRDFTIEDILIEQFSSYLIGLESGDQENVTLQRIRGRLCGADAFDNKQRGPGMRNIGVRMSDINFSQFGLRVDGQAGIDFHGHAILNRIRVHNFGNESSQTVGIRFRTFGDRDVPYEGEQARGSVLSQFDVDGRDNLGETFGVQAGSEDCSISQGFIQGTSTGVGFVGNERGQAMRGSCSQVTVDGATDDAFYGASQNVGWSHCRSINSGVGFRLTGADQTLIDCRDFGSGTPLVGTPPGLTKLGGNV